MDFNAILQTPVLSGFTLGTVLEVLVIVIIGFVVKSLVKSLVVKLLSHSKALDATLKSFILSALNIVLWVFIVLIAADHLGIPITSLIAAISVVGVALSLALQNILSNVFSGMTILATRPVEVGEFVEIGGLVGTVKKINLFHTVLETPGGAAVYIPNGNITDSKVINYSDLPVRRLEIEVSASYDDEPAKVIETLKMAAMTTDLVLKDREPIGYVTGYNNSSIGYMLFAYCENKDFLAAKFALTERIFYAFKENGVTMTYDHLNVHIDNK